MAENMIVYKCPECGADIQFSAAEGKMKCRYCDGEFDIKELEDYDKGHFKQKPEEFNWKSFDERKGREDWSADELNQLATYRCSHCGGEIIGEGTTMATKCPYCDNPVVMGESIDGLLRPDLIIPFKKTPDDVQEAFKRFMKGKLLLPSKFKKRNKPENLKGLYVPFWLFDCDSDGQADFTATKVTSWRSGDYRYRKTAYYSVKRAGKMTFLDIPVDSSTKMDDSFMESIEPYNYRDIEKFNSAYLAGYMSDRYDVDVKDSIERANRRIRASTSEMLRSTVYGYNSVSTSSLSVQIKEGDIQYALLPVWMMNTEYKGKTYTIAMNGQTGKMVGELPIDYLRLVLYLLAAFPIIAAILTLLFGMM